MLYEIFFLVVCILIPFFCLYSFRCGFKYGKNTEREVEKKINLPKKNSKKQQNEELDRLNKDIEAINGYFGPFGGKQ